MTSRKGKTSYPTGGRPWIEHMYQWLRANPETSQAELARQVGIKPQKARDVAALENS